MTLGQIITNEGVTLADIYEYMVDMEQMKAEHDKERSYWAAVDHMEDDTHEEYLDPFSDEYQERYGHLHHTPQDEDLPF